jgi:hypothetical protein
VPLPEYLLVTPLLLPLLAPTAREGATPLALDLEGFGSVDAWYVGLESPAAGDADPPLSWARRRARQLALALATLPQLALRRKPCEGFRNVDMTPP